MAYGMAQIPVTLSDLEGHFFTTDKTRHAVSLHLLSFLLIFDRILFANVFGVSPQNFKTSNGYSFSGTIAR